MAGHCKSGGRISQPAPSGVSHADDNIIPAGRGHMSDKERLLREADEAFAELRRAIEGLTDDEMRQGWFGSWGVREILIHISGWHEAMAPALGHIAGSEAPYPAGTYEDFDAWNARFVL